MPSVLYQHCGRNQPPYIGTALELKPGLNNLSVADWSAIEVPAGDVVTLYQGTNGTGLKRVIRGPATLDCFWNYAFDGQTYSNAQNGVGNMNDTIRSYSYVPGTTVPPQTPPPITTQAATVVEWTPYAKWRKLEAYTDPLGGSNYEYLKKSTVYWGRIKNSTNTSTWPNERASSLIPAGDMISLGTYQKTTSYDIDVFQVWVQEGDLLTVYRTDGSIAGKIVGRAELGGLELPETKPRDISHATVVSNDETVNILPVTQAPTTQAPISTTQAPTEADAYNPELEKALSEIRVKQTELTNLIAQKASTQRQLDISTAAIAALTNDLNSSYTQRKQLEGEIEERVAEIVGLQGQIAQLSRDISIMRAELIAQTESSNQQISLLNEERNQLKSLYEQVKTDYIHSNDTVLRLQAINSEAASAFEAEKRVMQNHINELVQRYNEKSQIVANIEKSTSSRQMTVFAFVDAVSWNSNGVLRVLSTSPDLKSVLLRPYKDRDISSAWIAQPDGSIVSLAGGRPLYLSDDACMMPTISTSKSPWTMVQRQAKYQVDLKSSSCIKFLEGVDGVKVTFGSGVGEGFFMIPVGTTTVE